MLIVYLTSSKELFVSDGYRVLNNSTLNREEEIVHYDASKSTLCLSEGFARNSDNSHSPNRKFQVSAKIITTADRYQNALQIRKKVIDENWEEYHRTQELSSYYTLKRLEVPNEIKKEIKRRMEEIKKAHIPTLVELLI